MHNKHHAQLLAVIGHPIAQSKSPLMHNRALSVQRLPYTYLAFDVHPEMLAQAVDGLRALGARGWNVTIPHKIAVLPLLDAVSDEARQIGAVNTVVNDGGKLYGYNTDGSGYLRSLQEETGLDVRGARVLILGAGGAARGVAYTLAVSGAAQLIIANRTLEKAERLADFLAPFTQTAAVPLSDAGKWMNGVALIVNTTSIGMYPHTESTPLPADIIPEGAVVSDLIYNPVKTTLLQEAERRGALIHSGLGMFVHQGALAYEKWTGVSPPVDVMRRAITPPGERGERP